MSSLTLVPVLCLLLLSASVNSYGIQAYFGVSCGADDCTTNVTTRAFTLASCDLVCDPCGLTGCAYIIFRSTVAGVEQFNCGSDSSCSSCSTFANYSCDTCTNLTSNFNAPYAGKLSCPVERIVGGTVSCGGTPDCVTSLTPALAVINKCQQVCNPCNTAQCYTGSYTLQGNDLLQIQYSDSKCSAAGAVLLNTFKCGVCTNTSNLGVTIPCPSVSTNDISTSLNDAVTKAAVASLINKDVRIPAGTSVNPPTTSSITDGVLSFALSVVSDVSLTPAQVADVRAAIAESIANQFNIIPISRVTITWAKKRDAQVTNTATVQIANGASFTKLPIFILSAVLLLWGLL